MALSTEYIIKYLSDISGAVQGAKQIESVNSTMLKNIQNQYGGITKIIGNLPTQVKSIPIRVDGKEAIKTLTTVGFAAETASGKFINVSTTTSKLGNDFKTTSTSVKNVTDQFVKTNLEAAKGGKIFTNFADNVKQLAGRAILTIPIWIALRGAIMGVFSGISGGIKNLIDFDLALQKIRNNLQGTPEEVAVAFKKIRSSITDASKATGISTEELARAVKEFATLGFSANESLQGALGASKLSIALFGDAGETAGAFARALNILIDRSEGAKSAVDQMNEAFALTSQLEETNNFEIKNVTEALDKFAGTAAGVGLTMNQTLSILAALGTAGRRGSEGATLLSTSFNQLLANLPKISKSLGLVVGAGDSTFTTFTRIINKITELNNTPGGQASAITAISDIFGGARGIKIVQSLIAVKEILDKNNATLPSFAALNQKASRTMESESGQAKILGNDLKEMGKTFITAIAGSEDFTGAIIKINEAVKITSAGLKTFGDTVNLVFTNFGFANTLSAAFIKGIKEVDVNATKEFQKLVDGLRGNLSISDLQVLIEKLTLKQKPGDTSAIQQIAALRTQLKKQIESGNVKAEIKADVKAAISLSDQQKVAKLVLNYKLNELKLQGATNDQLLEAKNLYTEQLGIVEDVVEKVQNLLSSEEAINEENKKLSDIQKSGIINNQLEILKLQGATNLQVVQQRIELEKMYNVNQTRADLLRNELELNQEITKEKLNQNAVSSDSLKLFEISQKFGIQTATKAADFLSGKIPVTSVESSGANSSLLPILKEFFASELEQRKAQEFFFKGQGIEIPIPERRAIQDFQPERLSSINLPPIQTNVGGINVEIKKLFSEKDTSKQILDAILEAIRSNPAIQSAIDEKIDNF